MNCAPISRSGRGGTGSLHGWSHFLLPESTEAELGRRSRPRSEYQGADADVLPGRGDAGRAGEARGRRDMADAGRPALRHDLQPRSQERIAPHDFSPCFPRPNASEDPRHPSFSGVTDLWRIAAQKHLSSHFFVERRSCYTPAMIATYHGVGCIKLTAGDTTLVFDPISKQSKHKAVSFGADIAFISLNHPDMNGADQAARGEKQPFVIRGPGEYEVSSVFAAGFPTTSEYGGESRINTVYALQFDGLSILNLGALSTPALPSAITEDMDSVDILFVPIGGSGVLSPSEAHKLAISLEAKVIIPTHWAETGEKDALKMFLKEAGSDKNEPVEKYTVKPKDILQSAGDVVVLRP